ncbi:MAG: 3'-5' exoribonuclease domain-containing protein [Planctomycetota bacterium]
MSNHIAILDIEALGAPPAHGVIIEVAILVLDVDSGEEVYAQDWRPCWALQIAAGMHVHPDTLAWHRAESSRRERLLALADWQCDAPLLMLGELQGVISRHLSPHGRPVIYMRGPDYDAAILLHLAMCCHSEDPFPHGKISLRDIRTAADLFPLPEDTPEADHTALADCRRDAPIALAHARSKCGRYDDKQGADLERREQDLIAVIGDDAAASTYQTIGQYRSALLRVAAKAESEGE